MGKVLSMFEFKKKRGLTYDPKKWCPDCSEIPESCFRCTLVRGMLGLPDVDPDPMAWVNKIISHESD